MTAQNLRLWKEDFKIHSYEIGPSGYVTPQSVCRFLQEVASNHAMSLGVSGEAVAGQEQMWVLSQLSLRMDVYPKWHESMSVETWPVLKMPIGIRGYRDFILRDAADAIIGRASTVWLLLNPETKRPMRIPLSLKPFASKGHADEILRGIKDSDFNGAPDAVMDFRIRGSDIDWNMHVNNVCYLEWALEAIPAEFRLKQKNIELDISFQAEGKYGNDVISERFKSPGEGDDVFLHRISEKSTGKVLGLLRTKWAPKVVS